MHRPFSGHAGQILRYEPACPSPRLVGLWRCRGRAGPAPRYPRPRAECAGFGGGGRSLADPQAFNTKRGIYPDSAGT
eukprot:gene19123-biopygen23462